MCQCRKAKGSAFCVVVGRVLFFVFFVVSLHVVLSLLAVGNGTKLLHAVGCCHTVTFVQRICGKIHRVWFLELLHVRLQQHDHMHCTGIAQCVSLFLAFGFGACLLHNTQNNVAIVQSIRCGVQVKHCLMTMQRDDCKWPGWNHVDSDVVTLLPARLHGLVLLQHNMQ